MSVHQATLCMAILVPFPLSRLSAWASTPGSFTQWLLCLLVDVEHCARIRRAVSMSCTLVARGASLSTFAFLLVALHTEHSPSAICTLNLISQHGACTLMLFADSAKLRRFLSAEMTPPVVFVGCCIGFVVVGCVVALWLLLYAMDKEKATTAAMQRSIDAARRAASHSVRSVSLSNEQLRTTVEQQSQELVQVRAALADVERQNADRILDGAV
jgi:hypothetical protein